MPVGFFKRGPKIAVADVDLFEARIGRRLPDDYREFLLTYNGGRPDHHVIREKATGDLGVNLFFGILGQEFFDIDAEQETMFDRIFKHHVSIAIDDCGNRFCLSLGPSDFGSVYFWDHEEEADDDEDPSERNLYLVADSFTGFWQRMEPIGRDEYLAEKGYDVSACARNVRKVDMAEVGPPITIADVDAFEERILATLPPEYREFLLTHNGGRPSPHVVHDRRLGDLHVARFLGISDQESRDIEVVYRNMPDDLAGRYLPIAVDDQGRTICLSIGRPDYGHIYLNTAYQDEPPPYFLAYSFPVLWTRMEPLELPERQDESSAPAG
jgi:cell wall assembly regulator SMI1